jgi:hypothetical protein
VDEGLLRRVAGIGLGAQEPEGDAVDGRLVAADEHLEGVEVTDLRLSHEHLVIDVDPHPG